MKIKYLGTAAYDGIPALFCQCPICQQARKNGGKDIRSRTQAIVNDDLLIDFNADTLVHYQKYLFDFSKIQNCLITHSHSDHLYFGDVEILGEAFSHKPKDYCFTFHTAQSGFDIINPLVQAGRVQNHCALHLVKPGDRFHINDYVILTIKADHDPNSCPVMYAIEKDGKRMLYGHDSGFFFEESIELLKTFGTLDFISLDCTGGLEHGWSKNHMSLDVNLALIERLKKEGIVTSSTKICIAHFSHNGKALHADLEKACEKYGIIVAYDGLEVEF